MTDKMRKLAIRSVSGTVLAAIMIGATLWSIYSFFAMLAVIAVLSLYEFYGLCRKKGYRPITWAGIAMSLSLFLIVAGVYITIFDKISACGDVVSDIIAVTVGCCVVGLLLVIPIALLIEMRRKNDASPFADVSTTIFGVLYTTIPIALLPAISLFECKWNDAFDGVWTPAIILCYIVITWSNDVFAYLTGITIGRNRICERISPKKSWEGFVGGVSFAILTGAACAWVMGYNIIVWAGLGLVVALSSVVGDFAESMFKREANVKDSGATIPGHGGMLDRFDSLLVSVPCAVVYLAIAYSITEMIK